MTNTLWCEKYRPATLETYLGNESVKAKLQQYINAQDIPHLLFNGPPGTGKTTAAKILISHIDSEVLSINASNERGIDTIRDKITSFASTRGFHDRKFVFLDECLDENTLVLVIRKTGHSETIPIKNVDPSIHKIVSFNMTSRVFEYESFDKLDQGDQEVYEIEFEDGSVVVCTESHKWYSDEKVVSTKELKEIGYISTVRM